ncbi:50S ribosomal protein L11 [Candidatus Pacearchaeota archaeon]|nr:50S ribosomal protein L11 [Candidatus Pacearchaeota archaeon]
MNIKLLVEGGEMKPGPTLSQKLGPAGINISQVIQKINDSTKNFPGMKVPVELNVDSSTKTFEVKVFSPPVSELLKKELGLEKGSGLQKKQYAGNISIEQIISVAKTKMPNLLCKDLKSAVKTVIGTCVSLGVLVENEPASLVGVQIDEGKFAKEISSEKTDLSQEKKSKLQEHFNKVREEQEKVIKQEQAAKEAAEAAAAAATATTTPATGAVPTAAAGTAVAAATTPVAAAPAAKEAPKKEEAKKKK